MLSFDFQESVSVGKCPKQVKILVGRSPVGKCLVEKCLVGKCLVGKGHGTISMCVYRACTVAKCTHMQIKEVTMALRYYILPC